MIIEMRFSRMRKHLYFETGEHHKALPFFERALNILKQSVPANHPHLQSVQEAVTFLKRKL